jgi:hypothetical protein
MCDAHSVGNYYSSSLRVGSTTRFVQSLLGVIRASYEKSVRATGSTFLPLADMLSRGEAVAARSREQKTRSNID